ncbi:MAG TPA: toxin TcdB middle/N-terminal domain-containing protein [Polyangiaceae bacterium]|nr:toxin TcdB middle/N-terminal domain-containing protein [Polyangiaceae bacterium]
MWIASVAMALGTTAWSSPADASGVDPTRVSLPKGPGSIEGLASADVSPSIATGSASYAIGIEVPPGSAGFGPTLSLAYDSGGGVSEIGIGWRIGGVPKLRRRTENGLPRFDDTDAFEIDGVGIPCDLVEISSGIFRPTFEDGSFVRVERSTDGDEWEARTKAGVTLRFGGAGFVESEGEHTSGYLLSEELDRHGHRIDYEWDATEGRALLTHVTWNDFDPSSRNELRFDYETRPDRHTLFSAGILETLSRRLHAVEVLHGGALVRRYELAYADGAHPVLQSIQLVGRDGTSRLPASTFDYTEASLTTGDQVVTMTNPPGRSPSDPDVTLADLDGDGLPDLLVGEAGQFRTYLNHDGKSWLSPLDWGSASPSVSLSETGVQLADLDADGAADLVVKSGTANFRYFPRPAATNFGAPVPIATVPSFSFEDPDVRLGDMDGDRRIDVVVTTEAGVAVGYNRDGTDWTEPVVTGVVDANTPVRFSDGQTSLCDVNGDRVLDLCSLHSGGMTYWLGRGRGVFQAGIAAQGVPSFDVASPYQLVDVDGDGWVDLLRVDVTRVSIALAVSEGVFGPLQTIEGTPTRTPETRIELADVNGSGTTDIVWIDVSADGTAAWRTLELFPNGRAGLVRRIDDGLGKVQTIDYEPAALEAARARDSGKPWATRPNMAMPVVARVTADLSLGDPPVITEFSYRDGAYDPNERTFAGFGGSVRRQLGDAATPTLVTDSTADLGLVHRELRGAPLDERALDDAGNVFSETSHGYTSRTLATALDGRTVAYSFASSERVDHVDGGAAPTRTTLSEFDQDDFGDVTVERHWGEISGNDDLVGNDEAIVTRTFANDSDDWLLGYVATEEVTDAGGRRVSLDRKYYDGAPFVGLPVGQVSRGQVSREEAWVGPNDEDVELVIATAYDADGLPTETKDGRGGGRFYQWASEHTSILSERVKLDSAVTLVETASVDGAFGALLAATDYAGQTTSYEYDAFGRLTAVVKPGDSPELPTTQYAYEVGVPLSRVVTESRVTSGKPDVERSETLFDGGGRERGTLTRDGARWILAGLSLFDARGQARRTLIPRAVDDVAAQTPPLLDGTPAGNDTFRDALGREVGTRSPSGIATRTEYAPFVTQHWDGGQNDATTSYEHTPTVELHDGLGRVVGHQRTLGGKVLASAYTYDPNGALLTRSDPEGNVASYDYDGRGRRTAVHDPDLGDHAFTFDAAGDVVLRTYPDGVVARFTYDLAGRALTEDWNGDGTPEIVRTWDVAPSGTADPLYRGKLARVVEPTGSVEHNYDARGRITSTRYDIDGASYTAGSAYDAQDREVVHVYPDGSSIAIRRNDRGQIAGYGHAVDIDYGDDGLEVARRFSTGVTQASSYDADRRRTELTLADANGSVIEHLKWAYDPAGNLMRLSDLRPGVAPDRDRSEAYGYDNLYRLAAATGTWGKTSYRFSPSGNLGGRTSSVASQSVATVTYGARPHAPTSFDGGQIDVDGRGRMTHDGARTYTWNDADQLVAVANVDGSS